MTPSVNHSSLFGMVKVQKIRVLGMAKLHAIAIGFLGVIAGVLYSFGGLVIDTLASLHWITSSETPGLSYGTVLAFGALIGMPIIFASVGFVAGAVIAVLYNLIARWIGGIDFEVR